MDCFRKAPRGAIMVAAVLLITYSNTFRCFQHGQPLHAGIEPKTIQKRETPDEQEQNGQNMYGDGIRIGSYLQAAAFIIGFSAFPNLDPASHFSGIILALQLLLRWWIRLKTDHAISIPELWIGLAQLLLFTTPGTFLLFLSYSYTRSQWKTTGNSELLRKEVIRGVGVSFLQVFIVLAWVNVTNVHFAIILSRPDSYPEAFLPSNPIWMLKIWEARSSLFKTFVWIQAGATIVCAGIPYSFYLVAFFHYVHDVNIADFFGAKRKSRRAQSQDSRIREQRYHRIQEYDRKRRQTPNCMHRLLSKLWSPLKRFAIFILAVLLAVYAAILAFSIEETIGAANLKRAENLLDPDQLSSLITGILAVLSASVNVANDRLQSETPVRYEQLTDGTTLIFTKNGKPISDRELGRMKRGGQEPIQLEQV